MQPCSKPQPFLISIYTCRLGISIEAVLKEKGGEIEKERKKEREKGQKKEREIEKKQKKERKRGKEQKRERERERERNSERERKIAKNKRAIEAQMKSECSSQTDRQDKGKIDG